MKNSSIKKRYFIIGTFILLMGFAFFWIRRSSEKNPTNVAAVTKQDLIQRITIARVVVPQKKAIVTAPYSGYVKKIFVKIGDHVKQGDPLFTIGQSTHAAEEAFPLRSPMDGIVVQAQQTEGEYVKEGDVKEFILRVDDPSRLYIDASVAEIDRVKMKLNQAALIKASAISNRSYNGIIRELALSAREKEQWSRSQAIEFPVRIEIMDKDDSLRSGMSVVVDVIAAKKENVLTLRHEFVRRAKEKYFVILESGVRQDIEVGIQNEEVFEIVAGLHEGSRVKQIDFLDLESVDGSSARN